MGAQRALQRRLGVVGGHERIADPGSHVLMIALELCSLTFQRNDLSKRNLVACSLFADGNTSCTCPHGKLRPHSPTRCKHVEALIAAGMFELVWTKRAD